MSRSPPHESFASTVALLGLGLAGSDPAGANAPANSHSESVADAASAVFFSAHIWNGACAQCQRSARARPRVMEYESTRRDSHG